MGEVIVRMEMPAEHCMDCRYMVSRDNDDCILQSDEANEQAKSWEDLKAGCPFVAVLPEKHGRLVDADELIAILRKKSKEFSDSKYGEGVKCGLADARDHIAKAQTIVPATERSDE